MTPPVAADTTSATRHSEMISPTGLELHWRMDLFPSMQTTSKI
jgi:hypothetical protein